MKVEILHKHKTTEEFEVDGDVWVVGYNSSSIYSHKIPEDEKIMSVQVFPKNTKVFIQTWAK